MKFGDKFLVMLGVVLVVVLGGGMLIASNPLGASEFFGEVWLGIKIVFFSGLACGGAYAFVRIRQAGQYRIVRDRGGEGVVRAVIQMPVAGQPGQIIQIASVGEASPIDAFRARQAEIKMLQDLLRLGKVVDANTPEAEEEDEWVYIDEDGNEVPAPDEQPQIAPPGPPSLVRYEDIRAYIPTDHALIGVDGAGIVTRHKGIKALTWVPGASGSGKTNSVCLRVDEDYRWGHWFYVIDPHWFKHDSLINAIKGYSDRFLMPYASETEDILNVLDAFLNEFRRRKAGGSWEFPITILIDEVGSLVSDKPENDEEKLMQDKIKQIARICGQESRGFDMCGMFISQDAAGLAWLRKRAILVLAHQMMMMSERKLACNGNDVIAREMDTWPKGRTLVYGIGMEEGQRVLQQPMFQPRKVVESNTDPLLPRTSNQGSGDVVGEVAQEAGGSGGSNQTLPADFTVIKELREIGKRLKKGEDKTAILKSYGLPWGRATQELSAVIDSVEEQLKQAGEM